MTKFNRQSLDVTVIMNEGCVPSFIAHSGCISLIFNLRRVDKIERLAEIESVRDAGNTAEFMVQQRRYNAHNNKVQRSVSARLTTINAECSLERR
jgi:hypothetical protein